MGQLRRSCPRGKLLPGAGHWTKRPLQKKKELRGDVASPTPDFQKPRGLGTIQSGGGGSEYSISPAQFPGSRASETPLLYPLSPCAFLQVKDSKH